MSVKTRSRTRPAFLQFHLGKFLIACLVVGALGGKAYSYTKDIIQTYYAVPTIERHGAVVYSDFVDRYGFFPPNRQRSWGPLVEWSMSAPDQVYVGLKQSREPDRLLTELSSLPRVRSVILAAAAVTSDDLQQLVGIRGVEEVRLSGTSIDDHGLAHLTKLPHMKRLDVSYTEISDRALFYIRDMPSLEELRVDNTNVTKVGLSYIRQSCPQVQVQAGTLPRRSLELPIAQLSTGDMLEGSTLE